MRNKYYCRVEGFSRFVADEYVGDVLLPKWKLVLRVLGFGSYVFLPYSSHLSTMIRCIQIVGGKAVYQFLFV